MGNNPAHPKGFGKPQNEPPPTWTNHPLRDRIKDAGGGVYYATIKDPVLEGSDVWVWHWHTPSPDKGVDRRALSACGLHTVEQDDPLTLSPSLACEDGCPTHGYIENGVWRSV